MAYVEDVLRFWFDELTPEQWFRKDDALDAEIRTRFADTLTSLAAGFDMEDALRTPDSALAAVIVLDQFPRNIFRGSPQAFATDPVALRLAKSVVERGLDRDVPLQRRVFLYLPYEHSENIDDQRTCMTLMATLGNDEYTRYAKAHYDIIECFGRFPHRNEALGRTSTPEEIEFLKQPGSGF